MSDGEDEIHWNVVPWPHRKSFFHQEAEMNHCTQKAGAQGHLEGPEPCSSDLEQVTAEEAQQGQILAG